MIPDRTPCPLRVVTLTVALLCASCGSFETPHAPGVSSTTPAGPGSVPLPLYEEVEVDITPSAGGLYPTPFSSNGDFLLMPAMGTMVYARFLVWGAPSTIAYDWRVAGGMLPPGVSLDPQTGEVSGIPTKSGDWRATLTADAREVVDGKLYVPRPYDMSIRVAPACRSSEECVISGFESYEIECRTGAFKGGSGGVCSLPVKADACPVAGERFQVWLHEADVLPPGKTLSFSGVAWSHTPCRTNGFSLDAGGADGFCVGIDAETPTDALSETSDGPGPRFLDLAYRLPLNYPAPIEVGRRYRFVYMRGNVYDGDHIGDGTLLVFEESDPKDDDGAASTLDLVLLAHTGRYLPNDLLNRCSGHGRCPGLSEAHVVPTTCLAVSQSTCGARTPTMLLARRSDGALTQLETGQRPLPLEIGAGANGPARSYALHLGLSDTFVGDEALRCAGGEDDYRLSYFVVPEDACVLARIEPEDGRTRTAPALLGVERTMAFSPSGRPLSFAWDVAQQPATNALFRDLEHLVSGLDLGDGSVDLVAFVPGYYAIRHLVSDAADTPSCDEDDTVWFAVEPPSRAYVELSHDLPGDLELRVAPVGVPWTALTGQLSDPRVASPANLLPDWGIAWAADADPREPPPFYQARAADLLDGAGVQWLDPGDSVGGRYRVGVLHRGDPSIRDAVTGGDDDTPVLARVRLVLNRNLDLDLSLDSPVAPCWFWEVGVLDLDAEPPTFSVSPHAPTRVCGQTATIDPTFEHQAKENPSPKTDFGRLPRASASASASYAL